MTDHVKTECDAGILTVTLSRADKKNALTNAMYGALADALGRAESDPAIRVVLLQGEGDSFTAGNDLSDFSAQSRGEHQGERHVLRFLNALASATRPLVAAVQGNAVGVGTTMLLHCDLVYVADSARLSTPFVNLALVPEAASSLLMPARIGYARAFAMFALGEVIDGAGAAALGLANAVVPSAELHARARAAAVALSRRPLGALAATKRLMRDAAVIGGQMDREGVIFQERLKSAEAREAFAAFAERRQPDFSKLAG
ncbi:enoyl-CoA hydratase-related protein [Bradyrhizobium sp. WD16]|uniref:enoyl-CoA hydratase-related protein n=1 Tax=Bradyrhizobium sp. WD16 TaxID=1521768 RepID=UPI0020A5CEAF|nr:enoyl-CoA hydratase-related protein [Bradyrhizobium sp. WD16]UTD29959.1 enoyl-CoA hydratase [Bradyrhizobium sp. WD16]